MEDGYLGDYGNIMIQVFLDTEVENPNLVVTVD